MISKSICFLKKPSLVYYAIFNCETKRKLNWQAEEFLNLPPTIAKVRPRNFTPLGTTTTPFWERIYFYTDLLQNKVTSLDYSCLRLG